MLPLFQSAWASCIPKKPFSSYDKRFGLSRLFSLSRCGDHPKPLHCSKFAAACETMSIWPLKALCIPFCSSFCFFLRFFFVEKCFSLCYPQFLLLHCPACGHFSAFPQTCLRCAANIWERKNKLLWLHPGMAQEGRIRRDHAQLLTRVVSKGFPLRSSTQSLKSTIFCKKNTSPILSCYTQEQMKKLPCISESKIVLNVDENPQSFLSYHLEKICHFQVFWLASIDSKIDLQFCPSEITGRDSWKYKLW